MATRMIYVELRLNMDHEDFTPEVQAAFVRALAHVGECEPSDIRILSVRPGCTVIRAKVPAHFAHKLNYFLWTVSNSTNGSEDAWEQFISGLPAEEKELIETFKLQAAHYDIDLIIRSHSSSDGRAVIFVPSWVQGRSAFGDWPVFLWTEFRGEYDQLRSPSFKTPIFDPAGAENTPIRPLCDVMARWISEEIPNAKLAFVAHSLGGIIVRRLVTHSAELEDGLDTRVANIAFLASPHDMAQFAYDAAKRLVGMDQKQRDMLTTDIPLLQELNEQWARWCSRNVQCHIKSFFTPGDEVLQRQPISLPSEEMMPILDRNHSSIALPDNPTDEPARLVRRFLLQTRFFENVTNPQMDEDRLKVLQAFFKGLITQNKGSDRINQPSPATGDKPTAARI
jgi:Putative serine esterase (DUF676)